MSTRNFYGREDELEILRQLKETKKAKLAVITGRRRIGKTRLIQEFCNGNFHYVFEGLAPGKEITDQIERDHFAEQLEFQLKLKKKCKASSWRELLAILAEKTKNRSVIIVFDEINWLGHNDPTFLDIFKQLWDQKFSLNQDLIIILSGSISSWIHRSILSDTKFLGRISLSLNLQELALKHCNLFWGKYKNRISNFEKLKILAMTGGVPRYLEEIIPKDTSENNIIRMAFSPEGLLFREFDQLFKDLYEKRQNIYREILIALLDGPKEPKEIMDIIEKERSGTFSNYFDELVKTGLICRENSWNLLSKKTSRIHRYRISDNYIRFYLQFVRPKINQIGRKTIKSFPKIESKLGYQFENLVLSNRHEIFKLLKIELGDILVDDPYFQRKTSRNKGCQIDYLIQTRFKTLYLCEIKYQIDRIGGQIIEEINNKISSLKIPKGFSIRPVLIHVSGVTPIVEEDDFFDKIIDFGLLLT